VRKPGQKLTRWGSKGMRLLRTWETLLLLAESPTPLTAREVHERLAGRYPFDDQPIGLATTREDLKLLRLCGFPVVALNPEGCELDEEADEESPGDFVANPPADAAPALAPDEDSATDPFDSAVWGSDLRGRYKNIRWALRDPSRGTLAAGAEGLRRPAVADIHTLAILRALLTRAAPPGFWLREAAGRLLNEVLRALNASLRAGTFGEADFASCIASFNKEYTGPEISEPTLRLMCGAIQRRQVLVGGYHNRAGESREAVIAPLAVYFSDGRTYVLAAGASDKKIRAWRLDRFADVQVASARPFPEISEDEIENSLRGTFHGYISNPRKVVLRIRPETAYLFREYRFHPTQQVELLGDQSLRVTLECAVGWGFEEWILGLGEHVEVEEPMELRDRIRQRHTQAAARYAILNKEPAWVKDETRR
jgi:predicted DNA-binding transcriptional regulator YafY